MTRNNLADHLSWLLNDLSLPKPTTPQLPTTADGSQSAPARSQSWDSSLARQVGLEDQKNTEERNLQKRATSNKPNGLESSSRNAQHLDLLTATENSMARLTSSGKANKPGLVSKPQQQLLTPASTTGFRSLQPETQAKRSIG